MPRAAKTRPIILRTAIDEFLRCGSRGLRVDRVAAESGANKRMIYHYFGDREGLVDAVVSALISRLPDWQAEPYLVEWFEQRVSAYKQHCSLIAEDIDTATADIDSAAVYRALLAEALVADNGMLSVSRLPRRVEQTLLGLCYPRPERPMLRVTSSSRPADDA